MFRIVEKNFFGRGKMIELFRYDQVASYEPYVEETTPSEQGEEPEFEECGIKIKLIGANAADADVKFGNCAHPYIKREFKLCFSKKDKTHDIINACNHFDFRFGVHSNSRALFRFGLTTAEKRNINAVKGAFDIVAGTSYLEFLTPCTADFDSLREKIIAAKGDDSFKFEEEHTSLVESMVEKDIYGNSIFYCEACDFKGSVYSENIDLPFVDISSDSWYYNYVQTAYDLGIIVGKSDELFEPDANMTCAEAAIVSRILFLNLRIELPKG